MKIVTGMHRSGTSFVSQLLHGLGADFGDPHELFRADKWNMNGYFENINVIDANNRMILGDKANIKFWLSENEQFTSRLKNTLLSRKWKYFFFPSLPAIHARAPHLRSDLQSLHGNYAARFVKDPRFCLTLKCWRDIGTIEKLVFIYRDPSLVAGSLARRERLPKAFGYRYWLYHVQNFFRQIEDGDELLLVDFDRFFSADDQDGEYQKVARWLRGGPLDANALGSLKKLLDVDLRTQKKSEERGLEMAFNVYQSLRDLEHHTGGSMSVDTADRNILKIINR